MTEPTVRIEDVPDRHRFEAMIDETVAGFLDYRRRGGRITLVHTEVDPAFEGRGVGSALARHALDEAVRAGDRVRVACPFVTSWLRRHHEYDAIIDSAA
jgi:predicted GNAT family acetyltransferase